MNEQTVVQARTSLTPAAKGMLHRQCACGQHTAAGGECEECKNKREGTLQRSAINSSPIHDPFEQEADRIACQIIAAPAHRPAVMAPPLIQGLARQPSRQANAVPASVAQTLAASGRPLEPTLRVDMEQRFGYDFSEVRVHSGLVAEQSARDVNAHAFTVGNNIVMGAGQYAPTTSAGMKLLAHELTHVVQQSNGTGSNNLLQRQGTGRTVPRLDVVYVMGSDGFHQAATRFFRARIPNATFVRNLRNLRDLLDHLSSTFSSPLGSIYIISHANEDGTLAFGLNRADSDDHLTAVELRNALSTTGAGGLPSIRGLVDEHTRIRIKGCDLGRNQQIVELFDQAFGGRGVVSAPTHEQGYQWDRREIETATSAAMSQHLQEFEAGLPPIPSPPSRVDRSLRGAARREATREFREATELRRRAQATRRAAIAAERRQFASEARRMGEEEGTHEFLSGPMFQRLGTMLFTQAEIQAEVRRLYPHLSARQQADLVRRLVAPDRRESRLAHRQGPFQQQGQRAYRYETPFPYTDPVTEAQIRAAFGQQFSRGHFSLDSFTMTTRTEGTATIHDYNMTGHDNRRGRQARSMTFQASSALVESDAMLIRRVQATVNNPDKFDWRVESTRSAGGTLTKKVIRERVVASLHHGSLNVSPSQRFVRPESDRRFFAVSTFAPPRPSAP